MSGRPAFRFTLPRVAASGLLQNVAVMGALALQPDPLRGAACGLIQSDVKATRIPIHLPQNSSR
eukprot:4007824-Karenia_brevis.AAC.1